MDLSGRLPEECTPENDELRVKEFSQEMLKKWQKGRAEHGKVVKIDPVEEAMKECLDLSNYVMDTYFRLKKLRRSKSTQVVGIPVIKIVMSSCLDLAHYAMDSYFQLKKLGKDIKEIASANKNSNKG